MTEEGISVKQPPPLQCRRCNRFIQQPVFTDDDLIRVAYVCSTFFFNPDVIRTAEKGECKYYLYKKEEDE